jgi:hypothetical protein
VNSAHCHSAKHASVCIPINDTVYYVSVVTVGKGKLREMDIMQKGCVARAQRKRGD